MPSDTFFNLSEKKRERVLDAAVREFLDKPYEKTSINRIIETADIPKGSFYQYFADKDELYLYCLSSLYAAAMEAFFSDRQTSLVLILRETAQLGYSEHFDRHRARIVSAVGEERYRFLRGVLDAPKPIRTSFNLQAATALIQPRIAEKLMDDQSLVSEGDADFTSFLLSMSGFLAAEYGELRELDSSALEDCSARYLDKILLGGAKQDQGHTHGAEVTPAVAHEEPPAPEAAYPVAEIHMEDGGVMRLELYHDRAPLTVASFVDLVRSGYYDGLSFHRVVKGFIIQGGSKVNACVGDDPGFTIKGEFRDNGVDTGLTHERGAISMARSQRPDSAGTQFFIIHQNAHSLDGQYAAFGKLIDEESFQVLDSIAGTPTKPSSEENRPLQPQIIRQITVRENGCKIPAPVRIPG